MKHISLPDGLEFQPPDITSSLDTARRAQMLQGELDAMHRFLWCVAQQQGGVLSVSDAEMAECPQHAVLVAERENWALRVAAQP